MSNLNLPEARRCRILFDNRLGTQYIYKCEFGDFSAQDTAMSFYKKTLKLVERAVSNKELTTTASGISCNLCKATSLTSLHPFSDGGVVVVNLIQGDQDSYLKYGALPPEHYKLTIGVIGKVMPGSSETTSSNPH